jgi:twinkle protein
MKILTNKGKAEIDVPADPNLNSKGELSILCPFCSHTREKHPNDKCASVNMKKAGHPFRCNHCEAKGYETVVSERDNYTVPKLKMDTTGFIDPKILKWYKDKRSISQETLEMFMVYSTKKFRVDKKKNDLAIAIPSIDNGCFVDIHYRFDNPKFFQREPDGVMIIFGIDMIKNANECIITEGKEDAMSWYEAGSDIPACSVPNGTTISPEEKAHFDKTGKVNVKNQLNLNYIDKHYQHFENKSVIYIATDDDAAGVKLRDELARRFGKHKCKYISFKKYNYTENGKEYSCKDSNDVLKHHGKEALLSLLGEASTFPVEGVITIDDDLASILYEYDNGKEKGLSTGFGTIDPHFNFMPSHVIAFNGYRQLGKTSFGFEMALTMSYLYDMKVGIYSPENYPTKRCYDTLIEMILDNSTDIERKARASKYEIVEYAARFLRNRIYFIEDDNIDGFTHGRLIEKFIEMTKQFGIKMCITDPWNNLIEERKFGETNIDTFLSRELGKQVRFAKAYNVINLITAHPRTPKDRSKMSTVASDMELYGGAVWGNKCHEIIAIHYDRTVNMNSAITDVGFYSQKVKEQKICGIPNPEDPINLRFNRRSGRYYELDEEGQYVDPLKNILKDIKTTKHYTFGF